MCGSRCLYFTGLHIIANQNLPLSIHTSRPQERSEAAAAAAGAAERAHADGAEQEAALAREREVGVAEHFKCECILRGLFYTQRGAQQAALAPEREAGGA